MFHPNDRLTPISWIIVEGFEVRGIGMKNGNTIISRHTDIHDAIPQGLSGNGYQITFEDNTVTRSGDFSLCQTDPSTCNQYHGLYFSGTYVNVVKNIFLGIWPQEFRSPAIRPTQLPRPDPNIQPRDTG